MTPTRDAEAASCNNGRATSRSFRIAPSPSRSCSIGWRNHGRPARPSRSIGGAAGRPNVARVAAP